MPTRVEGPPTSLDRIKSSFDPEICPKEGVGQLAGCRLSDPNSQARANALGGRVMGQLLEGMPVRLRCFVRDKNGSCPYAVTLDNSIEQHVALDEAGSRQEKVIVTTTNDTCILED